MQPQARFLVSSAAWPKEACSPTPEACRTLCWNLGRAGAGWYPSCCMFCLSVPRALTPNPDEHKPVMTSLWCRQARTVSTSTIQTVQLPEQGQVSILAPCALASSLKGPALSADCRFHTWSAGRPQILRQWSCFGSGDSLTSQELSLKGGEIVSLHQCRHSGPYSALAGTQHPPLPGLPKYGCWSDVPVVSVPHRTVPSDVLSASILGRLHF